VNAFAVTAFALAFVALLLAIVGLLPKPDTDGPSGTSALRRNASVLLVAGILCGAGGWMSLVR
jgi:hypothetical protein